MFALAVTLQRERLLFGETWLQWLTQQITDAAHPQAVRVT